MLGAIGFIVGAACIAFYAYTADRAYATVEQARKRPYVQAFGLLAAAMLVWSLTLMFSKPVSVERLLFVSDILLGFATVSMVFVIIPTAGAFERIAVKVAAAWMLGLRAFQYTPTGYVKDGLLHFNLTGGFRTALLLVFLLIWLPAALIVANRVARDKVIPGLQTALPFGFTLLVIITALFMSARRSAMIIVFFVGIALMFVLMSVANLLIMQLHKRSRHAA